MKTRLILHSQEGGVAHVRLNRPDKKNAINRSMYRDLVDLLQNAEEDASVHALVLSGNGATFTSGNDLVDFSQVAELSEEQAASLESNPVLAFLDTYRKFPKPIIVSVQGEAVGIGTTLLLHSDLCFADTSAQFSMPFVKLGLCPEFASSYLLPRLVGHAKAFEWLVLGRPFSSFEAHNFGLVNAVVDAPLDHALEAGKSIAALPPQAVKEAKRLIKSASMRAIDKSIAIEVQQFFRALSGGECAEAINAFFENREPNFNKET